MLSNKFKAPNTLLPTLCYAFLRHVGVSRSAFYPLVNHCSVALTGPFEPSKSTVSTASGGRNHRCIGELFW